VYKKVSFLPGETYLCRSPTKITRRLKSLKTDQTDQQIEGDQELWIFFFSKNILSFSGGTTNIRAGRKTYREKCYGIATAQEHVGFFTWERTPRIMLLLSAKTCQIFPGEFFFQILRFSRKKYHKNQYPPDKSIFNANTCVWVQKINHC